MKIAIISGPHRKEKDSSLLKEAGNFFEKVLFVPIDQVRVDIAEDVAVKYGGINLSDYGCVLPIPGLTYREVFYIVMCALSKSTYLPMSPEKYLFSTDELAFFQYLNRNDVMTRDLSVVSSPTQVREIISRNKFPMTVVDQHKRIVVTNPKTLKDVLSLIKVGTPIKIEPTIYAQRMMFLFLVGDEVVSSYERKGEQVNVIEADNDLKKIALKVRHLTGADYCSLSFYYSKDHWILNKFTISPDFQGIQQTTNKDVARALLEYLAEKSKKSVERSLGDMIGRFFRW
jgi:hypothetical protein